MDVVTKPSVRMQKEERQLPHGMRRVLDKDKINKFIEKIAPKRENRMKDLLASMSFFTKGKKRYAKVVYA